MASQVRIAAKERKISEIDSEKDIRVRIMGTVIAKSDDSITIDDGKDRMEIFFDDKDMIGRHSVGSLMRIIARVIPSIDGFELKGECIQDLKGLDIKAYKEIREIYEDAIRW